MTSIRSGKTTSVNPVPENHHRYAHTNINTATTPATTNMAIATNNNTYVNSNISTSARPAINHQSEDVKVPENATRGSVSDEDEHIMDIDSGNGYDGNGG